jgi:hypothetical protein
MSFYRWDRWRLSHEPAPTPALSGVGFGGLHGPGSRSAITPKLARGMGHTPRGCTNPGVGCSECLCHVQPRQFTHPGHLGLTEPARTCRRDLRRDPAVQDLGLVLVSQDRGPLYDVQAGRSSAPKARQNWVSWLLTWARLAAGETRPGSGAVDAWDLPGRRHPLRCGRDE